MKIKKKRNIAIIFNIIPLFCEHWARLFHSQFLWQYSIEAVAFSLCVCIFLLLLKIRLKRCEATITLPIFFFPVCREIFIISFNVTLLVCRMKVDTIHR